MRRAGDEKARSIGFSGAIKFFGDGKGMIVGRAITGFTICRTDAVPVLRDLQRRPVKFRKRGNEAGNDTGLANAAGMSADDDDGRKSVGSSFLLTFFRGARQKR